MALCFVEILCGMHLLFNDAQSMIVGADELGTWVFPNAYHTKIENLFKMQAT